MIAISGQRMVRLAAVGALAAALGLSACGRKGQLDPPPAAAAPIAPAVEPTAATAPTAGAAPAIVDSRGQPIQPAKRAARGAAAAPPTGRDPDFFLDWLLD